MASPPNRAASASAPPLTVRSSAGEVVAAPNGTSHATGSASDPLDLATALSTGSPARAGGFVLLRGGIYRGAFTSALRGKADRPIVVRSYPGEWAVLDAGLTAAPALTIRGSDTWYLDFEVTKSDPMRRSSQSGPQPTDIGRGKSKTNVLGDGIYDFAPRTKLINLVVHDAGNGIGFWQPAIDAEIYGCIVFNNGWVGTDHGWGHGVYVQNTFGTKKITDSIFFDNFGYGVHGYGQEGRTRGIDIEGVTSFENGAPSNTRYANVLVGTTSNPADEISIRDSALYHRPSTSGLNLRLGYTSLRGSSAGANGTVVVENNYVVGGSETASLREWQRATVVHNVFVGRPLKDGNGLLARLYTPGSSGSTGAAMPAYEWDQNVYRDTNSGNGQPTSFGLDTQAGSSDLSFAQWVSRTGYDRRSTYSRSLPSAADILVRPNRYERGRAIVTVFDWSGSASVPIDLASTGLHTGERFEVRDVQNLGGPSVVRGTYNGKSVSFPMNLHAVTPPVGNAPNAVTHTPRQFGVFLVVPVS